MSSYNNRRRVAQNQDSYFNTGIPCGNPQRYGSNEVMRMGTSSGKRKFNSEDDVETEAEKQLQTMAKRQLNTNITLKEQISQHRSFASSGEFNPLVKTISGVADLEHYHELVKHDRAVEELKTFGLTEAEVRLKQGNTTHASNYGVHPDAKTRQIEEINQRILAKSKGYESTSSLGVVEMGRRELEIEHRLAGENSQTLALSNFLTRQKVVKGDPNDPLNNLPELLGDIERKGRARKAENKYNQRKEWTSVKVGVDSEGGGDSCFIGPLLPEKDKLAESEVRDADDLDLDKVTDVDTKKTESVSSDKLKDDADVMETCVDEEGRRVVTDTVEHVPEDVIKKYRLKIEEIRALPRFENYNPGESSNVLYLKNLSNKVTEADLVSLFGRFQKDSCPKLVYRLMSGRMRGQAFVTFHDTDSATAALNLCNGYHFRGKPIIIQYGRKST